MAIELGRCRDCGGEAHRQTDTGRWWHDVALKTDCTADFASASFDPYVEDHKDHWRWCRRCDVKWWGRGMCWSCGTSVNGAFASLGGPSYDRSEQRWVDDGGPAR